MTRLLIPALILTLAGAASAQPPAPEKPVELGLEDQFGRKQDIAALRGAVVVLVYGDRRATDACRELGERLHVTFHPTAAGQSPGKARTAPVAPLQGVAAGKVSPDVFVVPVAAVGGVPAVVREFVRSQVKKAAPETPVWLDFGGTMEKGYGLRAGEPNLVVFDGEGRLRLKVAGAPDEAANAKLLQVVQNLRAEAAGIAGR